MPLALQAKSLFGAPSRLGVIVASTCTLIGGLLFRYTMVNGGLQSVDDPAATFELTKADPAEIAPAREDEPPPAREHPRAEGPVSHGEATFTGLDS